MQFRQILAVAGAGALAVAAHATTITHSLSQAITPGNSVSCNAGGLNTDNSYYRSFDLPAFGINNQFNVSAVEVGIEAVIGSPPIFVNLYIDTDGGLISGPDLSPISGSGAFFVSSADNGTVASIAVAGAVPGGSTLAVEVFSPDGRTAGTGFFIGSNAAGQTGPSYLKAPDCGVTIPLTTAAIGFPNMHIVMNVVGTEVPEPAALSLLALGGLALLRRR